MTKYKKRGNPVGVSSGTSGEIDIVHKTPWGGKNKSKGEFTRKTTVGKIIMRSTGGHFGRKLNLDIILMGDHAFKTKEIYEHLLRFFMDRPDFEIGSKKCYSENIHNRGVE